MESRNLNGTTANVLQVVQSVSTSSPTMNPTGKGARASSSPFFTSDWSVIEKLIEKLAKQRDHRILMHYIKLMEKCFVEQQKPTNISIFTRCSRPDTTITLTDYYLRHAQYLGMNPTEGIMAFILIVAFLGLNPEVKLDAFNMHCIWTIGIELTLQFMRHEELEKEELSKLSGLPLKEYKNMEHEFLGKIVDLRNIINSKNYLTFINMSNSQANCLSVSRENCSPIHDVKKASEEKPVSPVQPPCYRG